MGSLQGYQSKLVKRGTKVAQFYICTVFNPNLSARDYPQSISLSEINSP